MLKTIVELIFKVKILTEDEYVSMIINADQSESKLKSIKKCYDMLSNPLVTNAKEQLINLIESI